MGKIIVCDFCGKSANREIRYRAKSFKWGFSHGLLTEKLYLCGRCYEHMIGYIVKQSGGEKNE